MNTDAKIYCLATNPCHLWDQARGLSYLGRQVIFVSGYPRNRLAGDAHGCIIHSISGPTLLTYGITKILGRSGSIARRLYNWQDRLFDRATARYLAEELNDDESIVIGLPGQCLESFRVAKRWNSRCFLSHASGPIELQNRAIREEYERIGLEHTSILTSIHSQGRLEKEWALADIHLVASSQVIEQFLSLGFADDSLSLAPYGVDKNVFYKKERKSKPGDDFIVLFAGQTDIRKGIHWLMDAWSQVCNRVDWKLKIVGPSSPWLSERLERGENLKGVEYLGSMSQAKLADNMRSADVLVLPSIEDAFGLVVAQSLQCGTPCIVSDRVGAKDLLDSRARGRVVGYGDSRAIASALEDIERERPIVSDEFGYQEAAKTLMARLNVRK